MCYFAIFNDFKWLWIYATRILCGLHDKEKDPECEGKPYFTFPQIKLMTSPHFSHVLIGHICGYQIGNILKELIEYLGCEK